MAVDRRRVRRNSMLGTVLFVAGLALIVAYLLTGYQWQVIAGFVLLLPGLYLAYRAGRELSRPD